MAPACRTGRVRCTMEESLDGSKATYVDRRVLECVTTSEARPDSGHDESTVRALPHAPLGEKPHTESAGGCGASQPTLRARNRVTDEVRVRQRQLPADDQPFLRIEVRAPRACTLMHA